MKWRPNTVLAAIGDRAIYDGHLAGAAC